MMRTRKNGILRGAIPILTLVLAMCVGAPLLAQSAQQPELRYLESEHGFVLHGAPARDIALTPSRSSVRTFRGYYDLVFGVAYSPDGRTALSGGKDKTLRFWDVQTGKILRTFQGHMAEVLSVAYSPDGRTALSGSGDKTLRLWNIETGELLRTFRVHTNTVRSVAYSPDGRTALSGSGDKTLRLWNVETSELLRTFKGHTNSVQSVAYNPDGRTALSGSGDKTLRLWNIETGEQLRTFQGHRSGVTSVAYSPDGHTALSGSGDKTLRLWDIETGELLRTFQGHTDEVISVAYSPDGRTALSGSEDKTVRLWDIVTGRTLRTFQGHTDEVISVAYSPDGYTALSGGFDGILRLWQLFASDDQPLAFDEQLQATLQDKASQNLQQQLEDFAGPPVPDPDLPPVESHSQDPFETRQMFNERIALAKVKRTGQIAAIEQNYRAAVESRNAKVRKFEQDLEKHRLTATAEAVREVYGHPMLEALTHEDGNPKYDPEAERMYLSFRRRQAEQAQEWVFQVPPGTPARELYAALQAGSATASTHYRLAEGQLVLDAVYAHYGRARYPGKPVAAGEDYNPREAVAVVIGERDSLRDLRQQNPQFKDVQFEEFLVRELQEFDDDVPQLLERATAARIDRNKWLFVIGVEKYRETNDIAFSRRSAELFARVARKTLGIAENRSKILLDEDASSGAIADNLRRLLEEVGKEDSIYFYFSGHGIPVPSDENEPYILPVDKIPKFIGDDQFYRVDSIYRLLQASRARQVFLFMDSCFTGQADNRPLYEGVASGLIRPKKLRIEANGKLAVLTAGTEEQFSNAYPEKGHRLFSYFLMRELLEGHQTFGALALQVQAKVAAQTKGSGNLKQNPVARGNRDLEL